MQEPLTELARRAVARPAVVLDDDPTGTQTLRDVVVLTAWDADAIARHLNDPVVFLSTNSRALLEADAVNITRFTATEARQAASIAGRPISLVSRSDSTLRGHFPAEVQAIADGAGLTDARILLAPYFGEGGRLTVGDVHRLVRHGVATPVAKTEFARDAHFGYRSSNLRHWVAEKYAAVGQAAPATASLSLDLIRTAGPDGVAEALERLPPGSVAIANAETDPDIEVVALGALQAEENGLPLVARTAASYVRARAGRSPAPLLTATELGTHGPGVVIVGSHVETTTRQLERLVEAVDVAARELSIAELTGARRTAAIADAAEAMDTALAGGRIGLVSTERIQREVGLEEADAISKALVAIVAGVTTRPGWVVAKGGITSHVIARDALGMREARVAGQVLPGVPVWIGMQQSRWPGTPLVVFPGNVGADDALWRVVETLRG